MLFNKTLLHNIDIVSLQVQFLTRVIQLGLDKIFFSSNTLTVIARNPEVIVQTFAIIHGLVVYTSSPVHARIAQTLLRFHIGT